jgi:glycosyltransferase involved in cell wall biosynthesis
MDLGRDRGSSSASSEDDSMNIGSELTWVGPVVPSLDVHRYPAVSPAGNRWQLSLAKSLVRLKQSVHCIGYRPERTFPFGKISMQQDTRRECGVKISHVSAVNLIGVRDFVISQKIKTVLHGRRSDRGTVVFYNLDNINYRVAKSLRETRTVLVPIIADGSPRDFVRLKELRRSRCKAVFLSWGDYRTYGTATDLHLDGGVDQLLAPPTSKTPRVIVGYHGALGRHGGLANLLKGWNHIANKDASLFVTGQGDPSEVLKASESNRKIRYFGCLPQVELEAIQANVSVFVNPRPIEIAENRHNFPSKILEYIGSGRYVVSTRSPGISPDYEPHCIWTDNDNPKTIAEALDTALTQANTGKFPQVGREWIIRSRLWEKQAHRFLEWLTA